MIKNKEAESQEVSGPLSEILDRLRTSMEDQTRRNNEFTIDIPDRDLTPTATFEPAIARPSSPINFHAREAEEDDDDIYYSPSNLRGLGISHTELTRCRSDSLSARHQASCHQASSSCYDGSDDSSGLQTQSLRELKFTLAQKHLNYAREKISKDPEHKKLRKDIETPPFEKNRYPTWLREARPNFAEREDPKGQLLGVIYGDPTWTAQRLLDEWEAKDRTGGGAKSGRGGFWDEM